MSSLLDRPRTKPASIFVGTVQDNPISPADGVRVLVPSFDARSAWGPMPWFPRIGDNAGVVYPQKGDEALVLRDQRGRPWLVAFDAPDRAGEGGGGFDPTEIEARLDAIEAVGWVTNARVAADAAIAYTKLNLVDQIVNADIAAAAGIAKSKLAALNIVDADIAIGAAIAEAKLALASDAAAGTASRRTLGTGAAQAYPGNSGAALARVAPIATVTSLPGSPIDGDEIYYVADATDGIVWHLKYRSASASLYKWELVGGAAVFKEIETSQTTASTIAVDLTTVGPSYTVPLAGQYLLSPSANMFTSSGVAWLAYKIGAAAAVDWVVTGTAAFGYGIRRAIITVAAASTLLKLQYRVSAGTGTFAHRQFTLTPRRVG